MKPSPLLSSKASQCCVSHEMLKNLKKSFCSSWGKLPESIILVESRPWRLWLHMGRITVTCSCICKFAHSLSSVETNCLAISRVSLDLTLLDKPSSVANSLFLLQWGKQWIRSWVIFGSNGKNYIHLKPEEPFLAGKQLFQATVLHIQMFLW